MSTLLKILWYNQRFLVYPSGFAKRPRVVANPGLYRLPYEDVQLVTEDNVKLRCYLIQREKGKHENARGTVIMFHGNAMNLGDMMRSAINLYGENVNIFMLGYRGYGHSEGTPSEKGLALDAQAAMDYVLANPSLSGKPIIIYGPSLGGSVAIDVTSRNSDKIAALIIENTFTSIPDLVKGWPVIRHFSFLCTQKWRSASKVAQLPTTLPILMLSGLDDEVIPSSHMAALWDVASSRSKPTKKQGEKPGEEEEYIPPRLDQFKSFTDGTHNTTLGQPQYWETVFGFLKTVLEA